MNYVLRFVSLLLISGSLLSIGIPAAGYCQTSRPVLKKAEQVKNLSPAEAGRSYPVRLQGTVTYTDSNLQTLYIQDESCGLEIELQQPNRSLNPGDLVEIEGSSSPGSFLPTVMNARAKQLRSKALPAPRRIQPSRLDFRKDHGQWMELEGLVVQNAYEEGQYTVLDTYARDRRVQIRISDFSQAAASNLIDSTINAKGVLGVTADSARNPTGLILWVPRGWGVSIASAPPVAQAQLPVTSIAVLENNWKTAPPLHRIRVQGTVMPGEKENTLLIQDKTGIILAHPLFSRPIAPGDEVDLTGFADIGSPIPRIINATYLRIRAAAIESHQEKGLPLLTKASQIRRLDSSEAGRGYPVKLRGVITYHNPQLSMTFLQDETDAIYLQILDPAMSLSQGTSYEVEGFTAPGDFAPIVIKPVFRSMGPAKIPPAVFVNLDQLSTGDFDCRRVQVRGLIRSVTQVGNRWRLELSDQGKWIEVWTPYFANTVQVLALQDARVLVQGICSIQISPWGTLAGFRINVPSVEEIKVEQPAKYELFSVPLRSIRDVFRYTTREDSGHRVRIQGILLHQQPGTALYIKDKTGTMAIPVDHVLPISSNDLITVSGYPAPGTLAPTLEHASVRRISSGPAAEPRLLTDARALNNRFHAELVKIRGRLVDRVPTADGQSYLMQDLVDSRATFDAYLEEGSGRSAPEELRSGSELELTGIYLARAGGTNKFGFHLLLRTPQDIRLIKSAPWWTLKHLYWAFGILLCLILFAAIWAGMLKSRVNQQTAIIQQRLEVESALEKKYRELFEGSNDIVFSCGQTGKLNSINPAGSRILGYSSAELMDVDPRQLVAASSLPLISEWIKMKLSGAECSNLECELVAKDGRRIEVEVNGEIFHSGGEVIGAQGIARDITERKQAEEALRQSEEKLRQGQKLEAIGKLAGGIAHDFNNILSAILGFAELSMDELPKGHPVSPNLEQILKAGKRARDLVQQILAFSRKLEQERRPIPLQNILDEALKLLKATLPATIEISTHINPDCSPVLADATQMHQVILNLATNAAHAIGESGGEINIDLEQISVNGNLSGTVGELSPGKYARLSVTDTGPGIDPNIQKQIFEPYFTTKSVGQGSGLGLAVVHGIVQSHGGSITVASAPRKGACFQVYLPCCEENAVSPSAPQPELARGKGRILMVDDEEAIVNLGCRSLERLGYKVTAETHSISALETFMQNPEQFDLVITDQTMPHLTGLSLAKELWKIRPDLPVIISTGYSEQITAEKAAGFGFHTMLPKPYTASELAKAIKQSLA